MANSFLKPRSRLLPPGGQVNPLVPALDVLLVGKSGRSQLETFVVDSGADISLAPRQLCDELGLRWGDGAPIELLGISPRPECAVLARIIEIELIVPEVGVGLVIPVCFADGDASQLLGREAFFDVFTIEFDKRRLLTRFTLTEEPEE